MLVQSAIKLGSLDMPNRNYTKILLTTIFILMNLIIYQDFARGTPPVRPGLPQPFEYKVENIKRSKFVGDSFEYKVSFTANFLLKKVRVYFTKNDEVRLDYPLEEIRGNMSPGQTVSWVVMGIVRDKIYFEDGTSIFPFLRLEIEYLYPKKAIEAEVRRLYKNGDPNSPFRLNDYLFEMKYGFKDNEKCKRQKIWNP